MSEVQWLIEFGKSLKDLLEYAGTSQGELADIIGVSQATISRYVTGQQMPTMDNIVEIAFALDCNIDDLINFGESIH